MKYPSLGQLAALALAIGSAWAATSCGLDRTGGLLVKDGTGGATASGTGAGGTASSSSSSGTGGAGGAGAAPPTDCDTPADCQGQDSTCAQRVCTNHLCDWSYAAAETPCTENDGSVCDGGGLCVDCVSSLDCESAGCQNGIQTSGETCQGNDCIAISSPITCAPYGCGSGVCLTSCGSISDCASDHYCDAPTCLPTKPTGATCVLAEECISGDCVDGRCCDSACGGTCQACNNTNTGVADGTCAPVLLWQDPDSECGPLGCNGASACAPCGFEPSPLGGTCPSFCSNNCANNVCVITCDGKDECKTDTIPCPQGMSCELNCTGDNACEQATVHCPDNFACTVFCSDGHKSCADMVFNCSAFGTCEMVCGGGDTCKNADINCGSNECTAQCNGGDYPTLHNTNGACSFTTC
ncbi:MAG: hypothetical protein DRI90_03250 [Deltaproteobacteria bacterium]|nr:MAG: hypothetical protein DRI90_03250 [Deltaproteobacteria bacterium]